jgi:hypothetical protein
MCKIFIIIEANLWNLWKGGTWAHIHFDSQGGTLSDLFKLYDI